MIRYGVNIPIYRVGLLFSVQLNLLDLQPKEADINETHSSNEQTKISLISAQSQIIMHFTVVTHHLCTELLSHREFYCINEAGY